MDGCPAAVTVCHCINHDVQEIGECELKTCIIISF